jgi:hypothetical protein
VTAKRDELADQRDDPILEAKRQAEYIVAIEKERNALKFETEYFRGQCKLLQH